MNNKFEDIYKILKKDNRLVSKDGSLLKNKLHNLAMNMDEALLELLLSNETTKDLFFKNINNILIFDKVKFSWLIDSKDFLPDSYTAFKNKIMLTDDKGNSIKNSSDVVLSFPFKDCVLEADSTKDKEEREEIFLNEVLMKREIDALLSPKVFTNIKKYTNEGVQKIPSINDKDNLIIKGNNLLALHSLIPRYKNKIKCMYWDILYNTKSDNVPYNDSFKHTSWLTMMKNRLEVAKELLKEDGVIFIQLDDNELSYLKVLCDEIFGRTNFIQYVEIKSNDGAANEFQNPFMPKNCEYGLIYAKNKAKHKYKPYWVEREYDTAYNKIILNPEENDYRKWEFSTVNQAIDCEFEIIKNNLTNVLSEYNSLDKKQIDNIVKNVKKSFVSDFVIRNAERIFQTISPKNPSTALKFHLKESKSKIWSLYEREGLDNIYCLNGRMIRFYIKNIGVDTENNKNTFVKELGSLWTDISWTGISKEGGVTLKGGKKPEKLIRRILEMFSEEGDIFLDAYLGSGTSCAVAHKMGRQYIGIEQLDSHIELSLTRLNNVLNGEQSGISKKVAWNGGGSFIYCELKTLAQDFIKEIDTSNLENLNKLYTELKNNEFITYRVDINKLEENQEGFNSLTEDEKRKFLIQVIDKNLLYVNYSEIDDESYNVSEEDKFFNHSFYKKEI